MDKPVFDVHSWEKLSPFFNIARMIDLMTLFYQSDAGGHRSGEYYERDDHGGV